MLHLNTVSKLRLVRHCAESPYFSCIVNCIWCRVFYYSERESQSLDFEENVFTKHHFLHPKSGWNFIIFNLLHRK